MKLSTLTLPVAGLTLAIPAAAHAGYLYGFELVINSGETWGYNAPRVSFANTGSTQIASFSLGIGDDRYNFDAYVNPVATGDYSPTVIGPDGLDGEVRTDALTVDFTDFDLGESWSAALDIDHDELPPGRTGTVSDYRQVLWGEDAPPAQITVAFVDGFTLEGFLPSGYAAKLRAVWGGVEEIDYGVVGDLYYYAQHVAAAPMPTAALIGLALLGAAAARRRA